MRLSPRLARPENPPLTPKKGPKGLEVGWWRAEGLKEERMREDMGGDLEEEEEDGVVEEEC